MTSGLWECWGRLHQAAAAVGSAAMFLPRTGEGTGVGNPARSPTLLRLAPGSAAALGPRFTMCARRGQRCFLEHFSPLSFPGVLLPCRSRPRCAGPAVTTMGEPRLHTPRRRDYPRGRAALTVLP